MTKRERLIKAIKGELVDRAPIIAPAGLVCSVPKEVLDDVPSVSEPFGNDPESLANLSIALARKAGFESLGLPYLMTVESECYGGEIECGPLALVPRQYEFPYMAPGQHENLPRLNPAEDGRMPVVLETLRRLKRSHPDMPIIADIVAPVSLATSLMDTATLFKSFIKTPEVAHAFLEKLTENSIGFLRAQLEVGADVVFITDPASTSDNLGSELFGEFAAPFIDTLSEAAVKGGALAIVHICGRMEGFASSLMDCIKAPCLSLDDLSHIDLLAGKFAIMGGLKSAPLFQTGPAESEDEATTSAISILAPPCGLCR